MDIKKLGNEPDIGIFTISMNNDSFKRYICYKLDNTTIGDIEENFDKYLSYKPESGETKLFHFETGLSLASFDKNLLIKNSKIKKNDRFYSVFVKNENLYDLQHMKIDTTLSVNYENNIINKYNKSPLLCPKDEDENIIFIKTLSNETITLGYDPSLTIEILKYLLFIKTEIKPEQQRIIFNGRQMEDGNILEKYNIQKKSTLHILLRLRGGMYHCTSGKNGDYQHLTETVIFVNLDKNIFIKQ
jgi:hypothetical protein